MRGVVLTKVRVENKSKENVGLLFQKYFLVPITKYLGYLIGNRPTFQIDFTDFLLSLLGFVFIFVVKLRETTKGGVV